MSDSRELTPTVPRPQVAEGTRPADELNGRAPEPARRAGTRQGHHVRAYNLTKAFARRIHAAYIVLTIIVLGLVAVPVVTLLYSSLKPTTSQLPFRVDGYSLSNFVNIFSTSKILELAANTAIFVGGTLVLTMVLSVGLAYVIERTDVPYRSFLESLVVAPMAVPGTVLVIAWLLVANPVNGPLTVVLGKMFGVNFDIYSLLGMIIVSGVFGVPSMYMMIAPQFSSFNTELEEVAASAGAGWRRRMRAIVLPLASPGIFAGAILLVVVTLEAFSIPALLGRGDGIFVFSTYIQQALQPPSGLPNYGAASAYGVLILVVAMALFELYRRQVKHANRFRVVTGVGYRPTVKPLGRWRFTVFALVLVYQAVGIVIPVLTLLWMSFLPYVQKFSWASFADFTLDNYEVIFRPGVFELARNTLIISLATATITTLLALCIVIVAVRGRFRGGGLLLEMTSLVYGVPSVVLGASILFFYLMAPIPLYGTIWIIVLGFVTAYLPRTTRQTQAGFLQLDNGLEEVGRVSGASAFTVNLRIVLPLMWPTLSRAWLWVFVHALGELPIALLLSTGDTRTIMVLVWQYLTESAAYPQASALAVMLLVVCTSITWLINRRNRRSSEGGAL
ncbi:iron ABC transporter permease [Phytohabitans sp. ZYX-F-186]|uniref:Iron ABC transporter permease n=1 Tax=Phytohabitans maris TaxID=3071409 RepID=A0ABU0ZLU3_9ACTN|nr:iron ABC transporter permease [Phytohabitans sp. ZYX-F-186]MDQ7907566.1 iron ABC transporter permease [Phytohabitans sp. ZYX-F-186]